MSCWWWKIFIHKKKSEIVTAAPVRNDLCSENYLHNIIYILMHIHRSSTRPGESSRKSSRSYDTRENLVRQKEIFLFLFLRYSRVYFECVVIREWDGVKNCSMRRQIAECVYVCSSSSCWRMAQQTTYDDRK